MEHGSIPLKQWFEDRPAAGRELASLLKQYQGRQDVLVLGLPRGGVPVASEISRLLELPLDVLIVRKLGAPGQPEFALGAIASGGTTVINEGILAWFRDSPALQRQIRVQRLEIERREKLYRGDRAPLRLENQTVILVDDGAATGASMLAAIRAARQLDAHKVVVALPVLSVDAYRKLTAEADDLVCVSVPPAFIAVGEWYQQFEQTGDEEVTDLLARAAAHAQGSSKASRDIT